MKYSLILVLVFIISCGDNHKVIDEPFYQEQWAIHYDLKSVKILKEIFL